MSVIHAENRFSDRRLLEAYNEGRAAVCIDWIQRRIDEHYTINQYSDGSYDMYHDDDPDEIIAEGMYLEELMLGYKIYTVLNNINR